MIEINEAFAAQVIASLAELGIDPASTASIRMAVRSRSTIRSVCRPRGGSSNVPLGFVSLIENLMMIAMAAWMAFEHAA